MVGVELRDGGAFAVLVSTDGEVRKQAEAAGEGPAVVEAVERLATEPASIGVAVPSLENGSATRAIELLVKRYASVVHTTPIPVGTAAAVAEHWIGAARGIADVVYFAVGDHVHAGIVRGGTAVMGRRGYGPAAGWLALNPVEREDYRRIGCLEAEVAAAGIVRRLVWRIKSGDHSRLQDLVDGDFTRITADRIVEGARGGDGVSISVMRDTAKYLGMAAANLAVIADPETIVVGGLMASAADLLLEAVRVEVSRRVPSSMAPSLNVVAASIGPEAAAIGAARLGAAGRR